jgi:hypothetical protein
MFGGDAHGVVRDALPRVRPDLDSVRCGWQAGVAGAPGRTYCRGEDGHHPGDRVASSDCRGSWELRPTWVRAAVRPATVALRRIGSQMVLQRAVLTDRLLFVGTPKCLF